MVLLRSRLNHLTLVSSEQDAFGDALWRQLRLEAEQAYAASPMLAPLFLDSIINQPSFEAAMFHRIAVRLKNDVISQPLILQAFHRASTATEDTSPRTQLLGIVGHPATTSNAGT